MRTIWIVNHYAIDPHVSSSGSRHYSLARGLADQGWNPVILAASTEHPTGKQRPGRGLCTDQERNGVHFRYLRAPSYRTGLGRLINIVVFTVALLCTRGTKGLPRPEIIIGSTVHPLAAWAASILARRFNVPFIFEIRDLWPQTLIDMGKIQQNGFPARLMRNLESLLCARADAIVTLLPYAHEYLESRGVSRDKIKWISNGSDTSAFSTNMQETNEKLTFMYLGSLGRANGVSTLLEAFLEAADSTPDSRLVIIGNGSEKGRLRERAEQSEHRSRIEFRQAVPKREVPDVAATADVLLINILDLDVYRYGVSMNKLFDYAAAARPIIIASNARNNLVKEAECGISVPADNKRAISDAIKHISAPTFNIQRHKWGVNARKHVVEHYDYRVLSATLNQLLLEVLENRTHSNYRI